VLHVPGLFARNERLLCYIDSDAGRTAVVAVGAYNVGRISARFDPHWSGTGAPGDESAAAHVTNRAARRGRVRRYDPPVRVRRGEEIMAFHLGSTVVLLFEPEAVELVPAVVPGAEVRVGQEIARPLP
jgi:phosphatidylserine decarboxylase